MFPFLSLLEVSDTHVFPGVESWVRSAGGADTPRLSVHLQPSQCVLRESILQGGPCPCPLPTAALGTGSAFCPEREQRPTLLVMCRSPVSTSGQLGCPRPPECVFHRGETTE